MATMPDNLLKRCPLKCRRHATLSATIYTWLPSKIAEGENAIRLYLNVESVFKRCPIGLTQREIETLAKTFFRMAGPAVRRELALEQFAQLDDTAMMDVIDEMLVRRRGKPPLSKPA